MRLVYIDEAGTSNPDQEPILVVAGVIVHADTKLIAIERHLDKLVERHIPPEKRDGFVFHATEIFGGGRVMKKRDPYWDAKRPEIARDLADIPRRFNLPVTIGHIERRKVTEIYELPSDTTLDKVTGVAHASAFVTCAVMVEQWMRAAASNEVCMLIVEDNQRMRTSIKNVQRHYQGRSLEALVLDGESTKLFPFRKIKEDPLFQEKTKSSVLQVADYCAFVCKRLIMNQHDERYRPYFSALYDYLVTFDDDRSLKQLSPRSKGFRPRIVRGPSR